MLVGGIFMSKSLIPENRENPPGIPKDILVKYKEIYYKDRETFHNNILENSLAPYEDMYQVLLEISKDTLTRYREEGIPESIYYETMSDIDVWAEDYKKKNGVLGLKEYKWIEKSLDMKVFKLGRLQFERIEDTKVYEYIRSIGIYEDVLILNTYIQSGQPLDFESCQESYKSAVKFFSNRENREAKIVFVCNSWILNPKLLDLLRADSNIAKFQKQYRIFSEDIDSRQMEERIFVNLEDNPENYKAVTTLQKKLRETLIKGEKIGTARGVFIWE